MNVPAIMLAGACLLTSLHAQDAFRKEGALEDQL